MTPRIGSLHPAHHAAIDPDRAAIVMASTGATTTYAQLDARSARFAELMHASGLAVGDHLAVMLPNGSLMLEVAWAALRAGLYLTPINTALTGAEAAYIVDDSTAKALIIDSRFAATASVLARQCTGVRNRWCANGAIPGWESLTASLDDTVRVTFDETEGALMLYSSGTTGRPKGIVRPLSGLPAGTSNPMRPLMERLQVDSSSIYLCPAPLHHAAPIGYCLGTHRAGGTVVLMERFDPEAMLAAVERYRVTHVQLVPTMFVRLLKLPADVRQRYDLSSLRRAVHAAAPCPPDVKQAMIEWWGPIIDEYYSGTEGIGITYLTADEWLQHRGSVGRPIVGSVHIVDDAGNEVAPGAVGTVYFASPERFEYFGDRHATQERHSPGGWATLDDVGWIDEDGYLYLTDRRTHMIVSGGVNVYPREAEDVLLQHAAVLDAAVIGVPDEDLGEVPLAVVQLVPGTVAAPELAHELIELCRARLAHYKCPRTIEFTDALPRQENGKLYKQALREPYWRGHHTRVV